MAQIYALWNAGPQLVHAPARVYQDLEFGEDVEGLVDLPIQQLIAELKQVFPQAVEKAGVLEGPGALGAVSITWSWQWLRVQVADLTPDEETQLRKLARRHRCGVFEPGTGTWSAADGD